MADLRREASQLLVSGSDSQIGILTSPVYILQTKRLLECLDHLARLYRRRTWNEVKSTIMHDNSILTAA